MIVKKRLKLIQIQLNRAEKENEKTKLLELFYIEDNKADTPILLDTKWS